MTRIHELLVPGAKPGPNTLDVCAPIDQSVIATLATADEQVAEKLVTDRRTGFFSFIGSARVGWTLRSKLAPGTRCALEHGGAAPVILEADADLDDAIPRLAKGGFYHAGQVCISVQRIFCDTSIAEEVATGIAALGEKMKIGDPIEETIEIGPLIRPREVERIDDWVQQAVAAGGKLLCGGKPLSDTTYAATALLNPPQGATISQQEIFGPVVCVYACDRMDDAIEQANALPFSFQASVFTRQIDRALRAYRRLDASAVMVNDHTAFRVDWMPFAGLRHSGLGVGGIPYTFEDMQVEKMLVMRSSELQ
jgi:acyl-CoA reductase-like NAD-dependent aldehyde dehydrogenase